MPWVTPTLREVRELVRDDVAAKLPGADATIPNSVLRVMADTNAGLAHLTLLYIDWLSLQLLPDTAETEWLSRHGQIWLTNSDNTLGRKTATFAEGVVNFTGINGTTVPEGTRLQSGGTVAYETTEEVFIGSGPTPANIRAIDPGAAGNQEVGSSLSLSTAVDGVDGNVIVVELVGGTDEENDEDLRIRVLERIRQPPMGGAAHDYVAWAKAVPGVTRAWAAPNEMGIGTVTVRFMMDDLRATSDPLTSGFPNAGDIEAVRAYLDSKRPVAIKDFFVVAPIAEPINFLINNLEEDDAATRAAIDVSVADMILERAKPSHSINGVLQPSQTIHKEWVSAAILEAEGVESFDLVMDDHVMPSNGHIGVMGTATYG